MSGSGTGTGTGYGVAVLTCEPARGGMVALKTRTGRRYVRVWKVAVDSLDVGSAIAAREADCIPDIGAAFPHDNDAVVVSVDPQQEGESRLFHVVVTYETPSGDMPPAQYNPLNDSWNIQWGSVRIERVADKDVVTGKPTLNSASMPFDPPYMRTIIHQSVRITRNEAAFDSDAMEALLNTTNAAQVTIIDKVAAIRCALMNDITATNGQRNGISYYAVTYDIEFAVDTHDVELLDHGLYYLDGNGKKARVLEDGKESEVPKPLNGAGAQLGAGADAVYIAYKFNETASWAALALNT